MSVRIRVLGSAAGGGFPQWNCQCCHCAAVRRGVPGYVARTQSSIAVTADDRHFVLVNASPDIRTQVLGAPLLRAGILRDMPFSAIILLDAQIDHVAGLPLLRESPRPLRIHCTPEVQQELRGRLPLLPLLEHYCGIEPHVIPLDGREFSVPEIEGVAFCAIPLESNAPPYSERRDRPAPGDNIGLVIRNTATSRRAFYAPGLGKIDERVRHEFESADCLLVDGTCWHDDDLARAGVGSRSARAMGHLPLAGAGGMIESLLAHPRARRILIHINNTNPILDATGEECKLLTRHGIEVAYDGQIIEI